jgi:hypothetical protein
MIILNPSYVLQVVTGGSEPIEINASWVDQIPAAGLNLPITFDPEPVNFLIDSPGVTVVVDGPAPLPVGIRRNIKDFTAYNAGVIAEQVTVQVFDGTIAATKYSFLLPPGYTVHYDDFHDWQTIDDQGRILVTGGAIIVVGSINISAGTTSNLATNYVFSNSNNVSFGLNNSTITASASFPPAFASINISAGTTSNNLSAVTFANSNGVSFGLDGSTITGSIATGITNINFSAGTTSNNLTAITFSNSNNVSFGLNGSTLTASVSALSSQGSINFSAGTTSNNLSAITFGNSNGVSFGLNGSTMTGSIIGVGTVSMFSQDADFVTHFPIAQAALSLQKMSLAMNLQATELAIIADFGGLSLSSGAVTISHGVYTLNGETASLASSATRLFSWTSGNNTADTGQFGGASGTRYRTLGVNYSMTPGDYLFGWAVLTANTVQSINIFGRAAMNIVGTYDGIEEDTFLNGVSTSSVAILPNSIVATDTGYVRTGFSALRQPGVILIGT